MNNDLISRQAAIDALDELPATVKCGRWYIDAEGNVRCTACKTKCLRDDIGINILSNYCPNCGARMKKETASND